MWTYAFQMNRGVVFPINVQPMFDKGSVRKLTSSVVPSTKFRKFGKFDKRTNRSTVVSNIKTGKQVFVDRFLTRCPSSIAHRY